MNITHIYKCIEYQRHYTHGLLSSAILYLICDLDGGWQVEYNTFCWNKDLYWNAPLYQTPEYGAKIKCMSGKATNIFWIIVESMNVL